VATLLAEPITVPEGDSFLQTPIKLIDGDLPELPRLTYLQMRRLHDQLVGLVGRTGPWPAPVVLVDRALPELPKLDRTQAARLATDLDRILHDPDA
jgi:hypothetical protein